MDLGECPKLHDLALRADYENAAQKKDYYYDVDVSLLYYMYFYLCYKATIKSLVF